MSPLTYENHAIRERADMLCLTDMWRASGAPDHKQSRFWLRSAQAVEFVEQTAKSYEISPEKLVAKRGRGGTWAHWQVAMRYAQYLTPEFAVWCNSVVRAHMEGKPASDPMRPFVREEVRQGRKAFTAELARRDVRNPRDYARATNATYTGLFGAPASRLCEKMGLRKKANLRDHLPRTELAAILLSECLAVETMEDERAWGADACIEATAMAAHSVSRAVADNRSNRRALPR